MFWKPSNYLGFFTLFGYPILLVTMKSNTVICEVFALILFLAVLSAGLADAQGEDKELMNCLCNCLAPEGGRFVCEYNTEDLGWSPSCRNLENGPCICKAYGCFRGPLPTSGECYDKCHAKTSDTPAQQKKQPSSGPTGEQAATAAAGAGILATAWAAVTSLFGGGGGKTPTPTTPGSGGGRSPEVLRSIQQDRRRMKKLEAESDWYNSWIGWLVTHRQEYDKAVVEDLSTLPDYARKLGGKTKDFLKKAYREVTDKNNWIALGEATQKTHDDIFKRPEESARKMGRFYRKVGEGIVNVGKGIWNNPVSFVKAILGIDNWEKVVDGKVPLGERLLRALYGAVDTTLNIASGKGLVKGAAVKATKAFDAAMDAGKGVKAVDAALDASKGVKAVDAAMDAGKGVKAADTALDAGKGAKVADTAMDSGKGAKAVDAGADAKKTADVVDDLTDAEKAANRRNAWDKARRAGRNKVEEFKKALRSGDRKRIRKATLDIQGDKQALREINRRSSSIKKAMNAEMNAIYRKTDRNVIKKVATEFGVDPKDVKIIKPTNPSKAVKVGADRDFCVRITKKVKVDGRVRKIEFDVPHNKLQKIYDDEFYKAAKGSKYAPGVKPSEFSKKMDQVCTSSTHPDAYGIKSDPILHPDHPGDLDVALKHPGRDFLDPAGVGKTTTFKGQELFNEANKIRATNPVKAEEMVGEGMRQVTKQYKNQVLARANALRAQGHAVSLPDKLDDAVKIMNRVDEGMSPVEAEKLLKKIGYTPDKVAKTIGETIESMQKLKPR